MKTHLFLFCGGAAIDNTGRPKPLMQISDGISLLIQFLKHIENNRSKNYSCITLLCDDGQEATIADNLRTLLEYPAAINIQTCGPHAKTLEKFEQALNAIGNDKTFVQFGYPDIFYFGELTPFVHEFPKDLTSVHISAAPLTSRFPHLIVDTYNNEIKGISNYNSPVPANPMHVFGGDLWGYANELLKLVKEFNSQTDVSIATLEYDFFFWLINQKKMKSVILYGERIWVDSPRDVKKLLDKLKDVK